MGVRLWQTTDLAVVYAPTSNPMPDRDPEGHGSQPKFDEILDLPLGDEEEEPHVLGGAPEISASTGRYRRRRAPRLLWFLLPLLLVVGAAAGLLLPKPGPPLASVSPSVLDFRDQKIGTTSAEVALSVANAGGRWLKEVSAEVVGDPESEFALASSTCTGLSLSDEDTCEFRFAFTPGSSGGRQGEIHVKSNGENGAIVIPVTGFGIAPRLTIEPQKMEFGSHLIGRKQSANMTIGNRGSASLEIDQVLVAGRNAGDFSRGQDDCTGKELQPGGTCQVTVLFAPVESGARAARVDVTTDFESARASLGLRGSGRREPPKISPSVSELRFGEQRVGSVGGALDLILSNAGKDSALFRRPEVDTSTGFRIESDRCGGATIRAGSSCTIRLLFGPRARGRASGTLKVAVEGLAKPLTVGLSGAGIEPELSADTFELDFATVRQTQSRDLQVSLSNRGSARLRTGGAQITGNGATDFTVLRNGCSSGIEPAGFCSISVRFQPRGTGESLAELAVEHDAAGSPLRVVLVGRALEPPVPRLEASQDLVDFGQQQVGDRSDYFTLRLNNTGTGRLILSSIEVVGANAGDFRMAAGTCEGLEFVAAQGSCTIGFRFSASVAGSRSADLVVVNNAGPPLRVRLRGQGL